MSSSKSLDVFLLSCPGGVFVVEGVVAEAAVEDPDEPVRERTEGLVMSGATASVSVVVGAGTG